MPENLQVDYIIVFVNEDDDENGELRDLFEQSLCDSGLLLDSQYIDSLYFVNVHVPNEVLFKYAEILKLYVPLLNERQLTGQTDEFTTFIKRTESKFNIKTTQVNEIELTTQFSVGNIDLFNLDKLRNNQLSRIMIASFILERQEVYFEDKKYTGINHLLSKGIYSAAYPLHDGFLDDASSERNNLLCNWSSLWNIYRYQPIPEIKNYFGPKVAIYFSWLGHYITMLIPASLMGLLSIAYGILTVDSDKLTKDICSSNVTMCPLCSKTCTFWKLQDTCTYSKVSYVIDNPVTIINSIFILFWASLYIQLWQRYRAKLIYRWGLTNFTEEDEPNRPEFDQVTNNTRFMNLTLSYSVVLLWVLLSLTTIFSITIYRMAVSTTKFLSVYWAGHSANILNLIAITILNHFYDQLSVWLTKKENLRTETQYANSLTLKSFLFKFVNYYSAAFYLAFFKGKFVGYPAKYNRIFGIRQEECQPGGCLFELTKQLTTIMIGQKIINLITQIIIPFVITKYKNWNMKKVVVSKVCEQRIDDYKLAQIDRQVLFNEYLTIVIQYGFVVLFVMAFPLAPFIALLTNSFEMRLDAAKFVKYYRRPLPERIKDIGIWIKVLKLITRMATASNAFIIAFSSNLIPKYVYSSKLNPEHTSDGFLEFSLAYFEIADFQNGTAPEENPNNVTTCRYLEFRNPPDHPLKYKRPLHYWHILAIRLAFIIMYHNLISLICYLIQWAVPAKSLKFSEQIKKERRLVNNVIINKKK